MDTNARNAERRNRIIELAKSDCVQLEDGDWYYFLDGKGAISAFDLRSIAEYLDSQNAKEPPHAAR